MRSEDSEAMSEERYRDFNIKVSEAPLDNDSLRGLKQGSLSQLPRMLRLVSIS